MCVMCIFMCLREKKRQVKSVNSVYLILSINQFRVLFKHELAIVRLHTVLRCNYVDTKIKR